MLLTECCGVAIAADCRYCQKCGYEARVVLHRQAVEEPPSSPCGTESIDQPPSAPRASTDTVLSSARPSPPARLGDAPRAISIIAVIDGRCGCDKCQASSPNLYRMIGVCYNCGAKPILMLFRAGDSTRALDCPVCGKWSGVHTQRLATPDEIPAALRAAAGVGGAPEEKK